MFFDRICVNQLGHFDANLLPVHLGQAVRIYLGVLPDRIGVDLVALAVHFLGPIAGGTNFHPTLGFIVCIPVGGVSASPSPILSSLQRLVDKLSNFFIGHRFFGPSGRLPRVVARQASQGGGRWRALRKTRDPESSDASGFFLTVAIVWV